MINEVRRSVTDTLTKMDRGLMVVFEGLDRSGKSTQVGMLHQWFLDSKVGAEKQSFPDRTTDIGGLINNFLLKKAKMPAESVHLLFSANRWEKNESILSALNDKKSLVIDRYAYSGVAYTAAKGKYSIEHLKNPDRGLVRPDLVFFLNVDPEAAKSRGDYGSEVYEILEFQVQVHKKFEGLKEDNWVFLDASKSKEELHREVVESILKYIDNQEVLGQPKKLWGVTRDY